MTTKANGVTGVALKRAIEGRDARMLSTFYADDALLRVIDHSNPPSRPRDIEGKAAIATFWDDICSRAMTHQVDVSVADESRIAFTQGCAYPDGAKVFCMTIVELDRGKIARQTAVQAWDE
jgi:ketosteroid isomerase-like protein